MQASNPPLLMQLIYAAGIVIVGISLLAGVKFAVSPSTQPYYAMIASKRLQHTVTVREGKDTNDDSDVGTATK